MLSVALLFCACAGQGVRYDYDLSEYVELAQLEQIRPVPAKSGQSVHFRTVGIFGFPL